MRVQTGCRDCALCTGNAFTGAGRDFRRLGMDVVTLGISNLMRRKCGACGHPMEEHQTQPQPQVVYVQQQPQEPQPALQASSGRVPGWYPDPIDRRCVTWWDGSRWVAETRRPR